MPKISIITVCRNEEFGIAKTAESIIHQTWQNFEWIVIDGASTDGTLDKLKPYAGRIERLVSEPDSGIYNAMNKGIRLARGEYLIFMNGGDAFHHSEVLQEVFGHGQQHADILYGNQVFHMANGDEYLVKTPTKIASPLYFTHSLIYHQASFVKKGLFYRFGMYDETLKVAADLKSWIIFALNKCSFKHLDIVISIFNLKGISAQHLEQVKEETNQIHSMYFHSDELYHNHSCFLDVSYRLLGFVPILKVKKRPCVSRFLLFNCIPFCYKSIK